MKTTLAAFFLTLALAFPNMPLEVNVSSNFSISDFAEALKSF